MNFSLQKHLFPGHICRLLLSDGSLDDCGTQGSDCSIVYIIVPDCVRGEREREREGEISKKMEGRREMRKKIEGRRERVEKAYKRKGKY